MYLGAVGKVQEMDIAEGIGEWRGGVRRARSIRGIRHRAGGWTIDSEIVVIEKTFGMMSMTIEIGY